MSAVSEAANIVSGQQAEGAMEGEAAAIYDLRCPLMRVGCEFQR
jgi:hypothetical protein